MNKVIHKDFCGFWIFKNRYSLILEDKNESLTEIIVSKEIYNKYNVGDIYENVS